MPVEHVCPSSPRLISSPDPLPPTHIFIVRHAAINSCPLPEFPPSAQPPHIRGGEDVQHLAFPARAAFEEVLPRSGQGHQQPVWRWPRFFVDARSWPVRQWPVFNR